MYRFPARPTCAQMIAIIWDFAGATDPSPFNTIAPLHMDYMEVVRWNNARREAWVTKAPANWLDVVLEVALNPPDDADGHQLDWYYEVEELLGEWSRLRPEVWISKVVPLLSDPKARPVILSASSRSATIRGAAPRALVPVLIPFVGEPNRLSDDELLSIIEILAASETTEAQALLAQLRNTVPLERTEVRKYL